MDAMEKREMGKISGGGIELIIYQKGEDPTAYLAVFYDGRVLGRLKNVIRGFADCQNFSDELEGWMKTQENIDGDMICKELSSIYKENWQNAGKDY